MLRVPQAKVHSPALLTIFLETICHLTALLSVTSRKSRLEVLSAHGYTFQKQSQKSYDTMDGPRM